MILKGFTIEELEDYLNHLIKTYFLIPKIIHTSPKTSKKAIAESLDRLEHCFEFINLKYYKENGQTVFNPLHSDHLASYLWFLADSHYHCEESDIIPELVSKLNRYMHGIDLHYTVKMPNIFLLVHPVGTIIGKAEFSDYITIYQNVTIGSEKTKYPKIGKYNIFYSRSSLLGDSELGENVVMGANSFLINKNVDSDKIVCGQYPNVEIKPNKLHNLRRVFNAEL